LKLQILIKVFLESLIPLINLNPIIRLRMHYVLLNLIKKKERENCPIAVIKYDNIIFCDMRIEIAMEEGTVFDIFKVELFTRDSS